MCGEFLFNKTSRRTNFPNLFLSRNSTCFGQFLCPSSGVFHCTFGTGICHAGLITAFKHEQVVLESCHQSRMTYTSAECTVNKLEVYDMTIGQDHICRMWRCSLLNSFRNPNDVPALVFTLTNVRPDNPFLPAYVRQLLSNVATVFVYLYSCRFSVSYLCLCLSAWLFAPKH